MSLRHTPSIKFGCGQSRPAVGTTSTLRPPSLWLTLPDHPGGVKRRVIQGNRARLALSSLRFLRQSLRVARDLPTMARTLDFAPYSNRSLSSSRAKVPMRSISP